MSSDWTPSLGIRKACIALLLRALILLPFWAALVWFITPTVVTLTGSISWSVVTGAAAIAVASIIPGLAIGSVLAKNLTEIAGFEGFIPFLLALITAAAVVWGGCAIAEAFRPLTGWAAFMVPLCTAGWAAIRIAHVTLLEGG